MTDMLKTLPETFPGAPTEDALLPLVGFKAARELHYATHEQQEAWDQIRALAAALDADDGRRFIGLASRAIHAGAVMQSFRGNHESIYAVASAAYHLADEHEIAHGHTEECRRRGYGLYQRAHDACMRESGYAVPRHVGPRCVCKEATGRDGRPPRCARRGGSPGPRWRDQDLERGGG